ncbi:MAG: RNA polymerase sigma factor [Actinobacteria bacterium]|nr:RNA polymerase sigma factor [Actinomycetota bacterium]
MGEGPSYVDRLSDAALLAAVSVGDEYAATVFVRRFQRQVYGLAAHMCGDAALAEDVAQRTFERVWLHATSYDSRRGSVRTWVLTICRRQTIDAWRLERSIPLDPDDLGDLLAPSTARSPEDHAEAAHEIDRARAEVLRLPLPQRRAVLLATLGGRTAAEIAEIEGVPLGTAKTRLRTGLGSLRQRMGQEDRADG